MKDRPEAIEVSLLPAPQAPPPAPAEAALRDSVPWRSRWTAQARGADGIPHRLPDHPVPLARPSWLADTAGVTAPPPRPFRLPAEAVLSGAVSQAQAEAVGMAMEAFRRQVPFLRDDGILLRPRLHGFMLADVPGSGRRRTVAAVVAAAQLDAEPSRTVLWITESPEGAAFAERSLRAVGVRSPVVPLPGKGAPAEGAVHAGPLPASAKRPPGREAGRLAEALAAQGGRPLIVVEALCASRGPLPQETMRALQELQLGAPKARVLLACDAAGPLADAAQAAEALSLAVRLDPSPEPDSPLGGWRSGSPRPAPGAERAVLRRLSQEGLMECRMPSLEGVPVSLERVPLAQGQRDLHRLWAGVWARARKGLQEAAGELRLRTGGSPKAIERLLGLAREVRETLVRRLPASFAGPRIARLASEASEAGEAVAVALPVQRSPALADSPEDAMAELLEACIPVQQMSPRNVSKGRAEMVPARNPDGSPAESPYALAHRARAVAACRMAEPLEDPADTLREALGGRLAEATGRPQRRPGKGRPAKRSRTVEEAEAREFEEGRRPVAALPWEGPRRALPKAPSERPVRLLLAGAGGSPESAVAAAMAARGMGRGLSGVAVVFPGLPLERRLAQDAAALLVRHGAVPQGAEARRATAPGRPPRTGSPPWREACLQVGSMHRWGESPLPGAAPGIVDGPGGLAEALPELGEAAQRTALARIDRTARKALPRHREAGTAQSETGVPERPFRETGVSFRLAGLPGREGALVLELEPEPGPGGEAGLPGALRNGTRPAQMAFALKSAATWGKASGARLLASPPGRRGGPCAALEIPGTGRWLVLRPGRPPKTEAAPPEGAEPLGKVPSGPGGWAAAGLDPETLSQGWNGGPGEGAGPGRAFLLEGPPPGPLIHRMPTPGLPRRLLALRVRGPDGAGERLVPGILLNPASLTGAAVHAVRCAEEARRRG